MGDYIDKQPWLIEIAIEPKSKADQEKVGVALAKLVAEDPSFRVTTDQELGQTIIKGMGELHLADKIDILKRTYKVDADIGAPQVAYREKMTRQATATYAHKKQTGGSGQYAEVKIVAEPLPAGSTPSFVFENEIVGGAVPNDFIPGVQKGLELVLGSGVLAGSPVVDLKVSLVNGKFHEVDLSALAFEIAARMALREALQKGGPVLLEPIMKVEVVTPEDYIELGNRRPEFAARPDSRPGHARQRQRHHRDGPARQHVLIRRQLALHESGACHVHDAVRSLRASSLARR